MMYTHRYISTSAAIMQIVFRIDFLVYCIIDYDSLVGCQDFIQQVYTTVSDWLQICVSTFSLINLANQMLYLCEANFQY